MPKKKEHYQLVEQMENNIMFKQMRNLHKRKYLTNKREKGIAVDSRLSGEEVRFLIFENEVGVTTKDNGVLCGTFDEMEKVFREGLEMIEFYRRN